MKEQERQLLFIVLVVVSTYKDGGLVRTSADGVFVGLHEDGEYHAISLEVKVRVSPNTVHRLCLEFESVCDGPNWESINGLSGHNFSMEIKMDSSGMPTIDPNLHKLVPESKELMQCLHHSYTYNTLLCQLIFGDKRSYLGSVRIQFPSQLLDAYCKILQHSRELAFDWVDMDGDAMPEVPDVVFQAFGDKKLKDLKMGQESFYCFFGFWRVLNGYCHRKHDNVRWPIPKTARIVPINVAAWNALKGGSDTITKLIELCQEQVGVRSENNIACARLLLYFGVTFH